MRFVAYGYNMNAGNHELIRQMAKVATNEPIDVYDLKHYEPVSAIDDVVFFFGDHWRMKQAKERECKIKIEFPDIDRLASGHGDEAERELAHEKLLKLKGALNSGDPSGISECIEEHQTNVIKEETLPDLTSQQILQQLQAAMDKQGIQAWEGPTKDGLKVRLTIEVEEGTADINITFAELYFIRAAIEALQIKELELVPKSSFLRKDDS